MKVPKVVAPAVVVPGEHSMHENLSIDIFYPDHPPRTESPLFARTKRKMITHDDIPCFICGTKTLREVHHYFVEWAFADGVDWELMRSMHPNFDWSKFKDPADFVDSPYNMLILCQAHHRGQHTGIHYMPYPLWIMQKHKRHDYVLTIDDIKVGIVSTPIQAV
jgi:hypothetical protein